MLSLANMIADPVHAREDWRGAAAFLLEHRGQTDGVVVRPSHILPLTVYSSGRLPLEVLDFPFDQSESGAFMANDMPKRAAQIEQDWGRVWLVSEQDRTDPHGFPQLRNAFLERLYENDPVYAWLADRYPIRAEERFVGIQLTLIDLKGGRTALGR